MRPYAKLISAGHGIDAEFARALPVAQKFDPSRIAEGMQDCVRFADLVHLTDVTGANPLGWHYPADVGVDRMTKIDSLVAGCDSRACLGERTDQSFAQGVLLPTYFETIAAGQPVVHGVVGVANNVLLSYSKLTVPLRASLRSSQVSHLLIISHIDIAIPLARSETRPLTFRERQCLALAASGLVTKQIAAEIGISEKTVDCISPALGTNLAPIRLHKPSQSTSPWQCWSADWSAKPDTLDISIGLAESITVITRDRKGWSSVAVYEAGVAQTTRRYLGSSLCHPS